jgi:hypothetical protein
MGYINRALAFFDSLVAVDAIYRKSFDKPRIIPVHPEFAKWPEEKAWVIVREDYGAIGLLDALDAAERKEGRIPWSFGRFRKPELDQMMAGKRVVWFPKEAVGDAAPLPAGENAQHAAARTKEGDRSRSDDSAS